MKQHKYTFRVNQNKGDVSALLQLADSQPVARLILGHGAGANMTHAHMQGIADSLSHCGIETLRYHFPYMEAGGGRTDNLPNCLDTIKGALQLSKSIDPNLPTFVGGHSFGGRMSSHFVSEYRDRPEIEGIEIQGAIYFSFPLHPAGKPGTSRADHLANINVPQLFLSGNRDKLAELELLQPIIKRLAGAELHVLETADHSYKILKRTRTSTESIYDEAARIAADFVKQNIK